MNPAFKSLYRKEWKIMRGIFIGPFVVTILIISISNLTNVQDIINLLLSIMAFGFVILPLAVLFSLNTEAIQLELFLHNPQSIHQLLFVKFLNGVIFAFSYLFILSFFVIGINMVWEVYSINWFLLFILLLFTSTQMIMISIFPTIVILLFWTLHQLWRTHLRGLSIIAVFVLLILSFQLMSLFWNSALYDLLTKWGSFSLPFDSYQVSELTVTSGLFHFSGLEGTVFLGTYVFYGIFTAVLYLVSAYMLDRKVEV
ncbi:hypothetical protein [Virgibacillus ainsalahensis]